MTDWYTGGISPSTRSPGESSVIRSELASIASSFLKMPSLQGKSNYVVRVNSSGTALESVRPDEVEPDNYTIGPAPSTIRPFKMGFTEWPYDFNDGGVAGAWTYEKVDQHGDMITHHLKDGLPWDEAYADDATYPAWIEASIASRLAGTGEGKDVFLAIDSLTQDRDALIGEWAEGGQGARSTPWDTRDFDDEEVIEAFSNYSINLIARFNPTHFSYGTEINELWQIGRLLDDDRWNKYIVFCEGVYANIKAAYPDLKVMTSFVLKTPDSEEMLSFRDQFQRIAAYTDVAGVSIYPYAFFTPNGDVKPDTLPANWLSQISSMAPGKPVAITETGWIAEDITVTTPDLSFSATSTPTIQNEYLGILLEEALQLKAEFVVWWCIADFDLGWDSTLQYIPDAALALVWKDIGLYDGDLVARPALTTWESWLDRDLYTYPEGRASSLTLDVLWEANTGSIVNRGNIFTDTLAANSGIVTRSIFSLFNITTDSLTTNSLYNLGISTFEGDVTMLGDAQAVNIAAEEIISAPTLLIADGEDGGFAGIDNLTVLTLFCDGPATIESLATGVLSCTELTAITSVTTGALSATDIEAITLDVNSVDTDSIKSSVSVVARDGEQDRRLWVGVFPSDGGNNIVLSATTVAESDPINNGTVDLTINCGDMFFNNTGEIGANLSTTPGTTGRFYRDVNGFVKVAL